MQKWPRLLSEFLYNHQKKEKEFKMLTQAWVILTNLMAKKKLAFWSISYTVENNVNKRLWVRREVAVTKVMYSSPSLIFTLIFIEFNSYLQTILNHSMSAVFCTPPKLSACISPSCPAAALWVKTNSREENWHQAFFSKHNKKLVINYIRKVGN